MSNGYYTDTKITDRDGDYLAINTDGSINVATVTTVSSVTLAAGQTIKINDGTDTLLVNTDGSLTVNTQPRYTAITSASSARTASGNSGTIALTGTPRAITFSIAVTAQSGTTPTIQFIPLISDANGILCEVAPRITAAAPVANTFWNFTFGEAVGADTLAAPTATTVVGKGSWSTVIPPNGNVRLDWVIAGTTPSITFQYGIMQMY